VAPGRYVLQSRTNPGPGGRGQMAAPRAPDSSIEFARQEITVGTEDVDNLVLVMQPGARLSGQVVTDTGEAPPFKADQIQVAARPAQIEFNSPVASARVAENFTFQLTGLFEARLIRANAPQGWSLKQVLLSGQDVTDTPVEFAPGQNVTGLQIVMTDKSTDLSGTLVDTRGDPVADATVVVFPSDEKLWTFQSRYIRAARPDQTGRYQIRGLPPYGDYLMAAVRGLEDGQAGDPEFLARVKSQAGALALKEGETKVADIKMPTAR
jgi:Carboxypeptidase regulatory-like domain